MEKKLTVDRIEEGISVCFDDEGNRYELSEALTEGDIFEANIDDDGRATLIKRSESEIIEKKSSLENRLNALFRRGDGKK